MYEHKHQLRVRYSETDQMSFVYHAHYASYFEVARVEALRNLGISYRKLEEDGILLPVLDLQIKFLKPARYDQLLTIRTTIVDMPGVRICFEYETTNEENEVLNRASTTLVFLDKAKNRPCPPPKELLDKLNAHLPKG